MAHLAKYSKGSIGTLSRHYERAKRENGEYIKFSNQDIDITKIHENYNLAPKRNQLEFIKQRCDEVHCLNRKDVNVMCSWLVTMPRDLKQGAQRKFFEETYKFLVKRYGGEKNVISAFVHMDETTPHLHFSFVPVVNDPKKNRDTVSAKIMLNRGDLQSFHKDLENHLSKIFGQEIGILNEATKEGNRSIDELKRQSATERLSEVQEIVKKNIALSEENTKNSEIEAKKIISEAKEKVKQSNSELRTIEAEYKSKKAYVNSHINQNGLFDGVTEKRTITGKLRAYELTPERFEEMSTTYMDERAVQKMQDSIEKSIENYKKGTSYNNFMAMKQNFEKEIKDLKSEIKGLSNKNKEMRNTINRIVKVFESTPEIEKSFYDKEKQIEQQEQRTKKQSKGWDMEL